LLDPHGGRPASAGLGALNNYCVFIQFMRSIIVAQALAHKMS